MVTWRKLSAADPHFGGLFEEVLRHKEQSAADGESAVRPILQEVKERGDEALFAFTQRFDRVTLDKDSVRVSPDDLARAYRNIGTVERDALGMAAERIEQYHRRQMHQSLSPDLPPDATVSDVLRPLGRVGVYVPGGKASYPSSVLMTAIPARVAGVREVIMVSPGTSPYVLAAAHIAGVDQVYRVGGAQAVAALAYGTESIARVDKIVGPGNRYVEAAKRLLFGCVGVDMVAGPSEVLIIADDSAVPAFAAADLLAQAEHDEDAVPAIISTSHALLAAVEQEVEAQLARTSRREIAERSISRNGVMLYTPLLAHAVELANSIAPEHLEIMVSNPRAVLDGISAAGAVFIGNYSPVAAGDYAAGPSHVLPTAGTARFFSCLGIQDFMRRMSVISLTRDEFMKLEAGSRMLAQLEGLDAHARALAIRTPEQE